MKSRQTRAKGGNSKNDNTYMTKLKLDKEFGGEVFVFGIDVGIACVIAYPYA